MPKTSKLWLSSQTSQKVRRPVSGADGESLHVLLDVSARALETLRFSNEWVPWRPFFVAHKAERQSSRI
jgi:hypothetical protein